MNVPTFIATGFFFCFCQHWLIVADFLQPLAFAAILTAGWLVPLLDCCFCKNIVILLTSLCYKCLLLLSKPVACYFLSPRLIVQLLTAGCCSYFYCCNQLIVDMIVATHCSFFICCCWLVGATS